ncbi:hypothetical protein SODALDRAFT_331316 [Sodiomyces alkalinus F11]|uniref:Uncharacterized protein n=1 Tax=Sodiomyces alkalinus (strain CBS 110278 / VKM F-3762 / F11) TaxID=1314773 RepID=A0A3N2Q493_SODAK|nr:hypothetical protein SODALDRAFT_331316 [Sodiomyces alkalinus F11]ROT41569.1 hypothetical protein SODALDRAFT_331316 [Sodiomyces alkalinus F11]
MDVLPTELLDAILQQCIDQGPRNDVLELRLVCSAFDCYLKPYVCRTVALEFSRLSAASGRRRPDPDALQTIGKHCKALYIDLTILRDEFEVEFLSTIFDEVPSMTHFIRTLQNRYSMCETSFTEIEYRRVVEEVLFNCRYIERLRVDLPFQFVDQRCNAATMILANTFSVLADRLSEEDSVPLRTLVLENLADPTIDNLWINPCDVFNIMRVLLHLENLVMTIRRPRHTSLLWHLTRHAEHLRTLCLIGNDDDRRPPRGLKQTKAWHVPLLEWHARSLPEPPLTGRDGQALLILPHLTCLELKRLELAPDVLPAIAQAFGSTLRELYLNEVYLKAEQGRHINPDSTQFLWIGLPNQRPGPDDLWMAMLIRSRCPSLRICRAAFLGYDQLIRDDVLHHNGADIHGTTGTLSFASPEFDFLDPSGLGRSVAQRFVEVVLGIAQPRAPPPDGRPITYLPPSPKDDHLLDELRPRPPAFRAADYDVNAYQTAVHNPTSRWQRSLDGVFPSCNAGTLAELHYIAETASQGMSEIQRGRRQELGIRERDLVDAVTVVGGAPVADDDVL